MIKHFQNGETMTNEICPLLSKDGKVVCLKQYCAWYDTELRMCAIRQIAVSLQALYSYGIRAYTSKVSI